MLTDYFDKWRDDIFFERTPGIFTGNDTIPRILQRYWQATVVTYVSVEYSTNHGFVHTNFIQIMERSLIKLTKLIK